MTVEEYSAYMKKHGFITVDLGVAEYYLYIDDEGDGPFIFIGLAPDDLGMLDILPLDSCTRNFMSTEEATGHILEEAELLCKTISLNVDRIRKEAGHEKK